MGNISGSNTRIYYPTLGSGGIIDYVNGSTAQTQQIENLLKNTKLITSVSLSVIKTEQGVYRQQLKDFTAAAHGVYNGAAALSKVNANQPTAQIMSEVNSVLESYNNMTNVAQNAQNISQEGQATITGIQKIMQSKQEDLAAVGITQNAATGQWQIDDKTLANALSSDQKTKEKATAILSNLGTTLSQAAGAVIKKPADDYFNSPVYDLAVQYIKNANKTKYLSYNKGIFLDLLA